MIDPAELAAWNRAQRIAADAYAMDESTRSGLCVTCNAAAPLRHRECRMCADNRRRRARTTP